MASNFPESQLLRILARCAHPPLVFVETGTLFGETTAFASKHFRIVHTIELQADLLAAAVLRYPELQNVTWHHGDTREVLPRLCRGIEEPVVFYLDAHWFSRHGAGGKGVFPLWDELEAIGRRSYADTVIVDDVKRFGTGVPELAWVDVTANSLVRVLGRVAVHETMGDQYVMWRSCA